MISVCIATHNGEKYIKEQLDSILCQLSTEDEVVISDDGSTDKTIDVILSLRDSRIQLYQYHQTAKGKVSHYYVCKNFEKALKQAKGDYIFLADQDDVWNSDKIEKTLKKYYELHENNFPVLIHSDLSVVDSNLNVIDDSFMTYTNTPKKLSWKNYLVENNNVVGCTVLINDFLAELYRKNCSKLNKEKIFMHDSFFAVLASLTGKIFYIDEPLLKYRQHENNTIGVKPIKSLFLIIKQKASELNSCKQLQIKKEDFAGEILKCCNFDDGKIKIVRQFSVLREKNKFSRLVFILNNGISRTSFLTNIYLYVTI